MTKEGVSTGLAVGALVLVGAAAWALQLRAPLVVDPQPLAGLPASVGAWEGVEVPVDSTVERILRADFHVQRAYLHPVGGVVWVYVGYYGTERGGRSAHTPEACYPADGWTVLSDRSRVVELHEGLRANELVVERGAERRLVHHWYRSHRSTGLVSELDHGLDRLIGRLVAGRADGAFVRISTPLDPASEDAARARLAAFAAEFDPLIGAHWPRERPVSQS